jgi:hypothetical protein
VAGGHIGRAKGMQQLLINLLMKLATETFLAKLVVYGGRQLAESTDNKLDNKIVDAVAEALDVDG